ncbi:MAG: DUF6089 family protein [Bacteroidia bacterium]
MNSIKPLVVFIIFTLTCISAKAQQIEIGMLFGTSHYLGDLSDEKINFKNTYFAASLFGRYNFSNKLAVKGMASYGRISGDDKQSSKDASKLRNLNFYTDIFEFSVHMEYNLLKNDLRNLHNRPFVPYIFAGIGVFNFNPKSDSLGKIYELQPLATEGQGSTAYNERKKYNLTEIMIPFGIGFRTRISDAFLIGFETGVRYTTTNYLDDVGGYYAENNIVKSNTGPTAAFLADRSNEIIPSHYFKETDLRSDKKNFQNDIYFISGITISYMIRSKGQACPNFFN